MTTQPLDMPDGPGWWAFEGKNSFLRQVQIVLQFIEWRKPLLDDNGVEIEVYHVAGDRYPTIYNGNHFRQKYNGKFYRLTMPWEQPTTPPAAPAPDWSETVEAERNIGFIEGVLEGVKTRIMAQKPVLRSQEYTVWRCDEVLAWLSTQRPRQG